MGLTGFNRTRRKKRHQEAEKAAEKAEPDTDLEALKERAKELGLKGYGNMKEGTLLKRIQEAEKAAENEE